MLAAIILALMTAWGLLIAASIIFVAIAVPTPQTAQYPLVVYIQIGFGIIALLISLFCGWTVFGLFRLQRWARYSILILGGLLAVFSALVTIFDCVLAFSSFVASPNPSGVPPATLRLILLAIAGFNVLLTLIGVWWLIYFNLGRIRSFFAPNEAPETNGAISTHTTELGNSSASVVEILLKCLAVLYLVGAVPGVLMAFFRFPLFFLGFTLRGSSATIVSLLLAAIGLSIGIGLFRRARFAWYAALAFNVFGLTSSVILFAPHNRASMIDYQQEINGRLFPGMNTLARQPSQVMQGPMWIPMALISFVCVGLVIWLLICARPLFDVAPNPALDEA